MPNLLSRNEVYVHVVWLQYIYVIRNVYLLGNIGNQCRCSGTNICLGSGLGQGGVMKNERNGVFWRACEAENIVYLFRMYVYVIPRSMCKASFNSAWSYNYSSIIKFARQSAPWLWQTVTENKSLRAHLWQESHCRQRSSPTASSTVVSNP
jgi:hypothetical protein